MHDTIIDLKGQDIARDSIIITLVADHGLTLNAATKAYGKCAKEQGWTTALVSHKADALEVIAEIWSNMDAITVKDIQDCIVDIVDRFAVAESTARDYIRAYCDNTGIEYPVTNPREAIFAWFKEQDGVADKKEFHAFAEELGRSKSNANEYWKGYELHLHLVG